MSYYRYRDNDDNNEKRNKLRSRKRPYKASYRVSSEKFENKTDGSIGKQVNIKGSAFRFSFFDKKIKHEKNYKVAARLDKLHRKTRNIVCFCRGRIVHNEAYFAFNSVAAAARKAAESSAKVEKRNCGRGDVDIFGVIEFLFLCVDKADEHRAEKSAVEDRSSEDLPENINDVGKAFAFRQKFGQNGDDFYIRYSVKDMSADKHPDKRPEHYAEHLNVVRLPFFRKHLRIAEDGEYSDKSENRIERNFLIENYDIGKHGSPYINKADRKIYLLYFRLSVNY